jgi:hypothetical protein
MARSPTVLASRACVTWQRFEENLIRSNFTPKTTVSEISVDQTTGVTTYSIILIL